MRITKHGDHITADIKLKSRGASVTIEYDATQCDGITGVYFYKYNHNATHFLYNTKEKEYFAFNLCDNLNEAEKAEVEEWSELIANACEYMTKEDKRADTLLYKVTHNEKKEVTSVELSQSQALNDLTTALYNKYIIKARYIKQVQYSYNYTDKQTLTVIYSNGYRDIFYNIPTSMGALALYKLKQ